LLYNYSRTKRPKSQYILFTRNHAVQCFHDPQPTILSHASQFKPPISGDNYSFFTILLYKKYHKMSLYCNTNFIYINGIPGLLRTAIIVVIFYFELENFYKYTKSSEHSSYNGFTELMESYSIFHFSYKNEKNLNHWIFYFKLRLFSFFNQFTNDIYCIV
jgi:hypothetical protein